MKDLNEDAETIAKHSKSNIQAAHAPSAQKNDLFLDLPELWYKHSAIWLLTGLQPLSVVLHHLRAPPQALLVILHRPLWMSLQSCTPQM